MKREPWHTALLQSLDALSDTDRQWRAWVERESANFAGPVELICQVFDDSGLSELLQAGQVFSPDADDLLRKMDALVLQINVDQPVEQLLNSARWLELAKLANQARLRISGRVME